MKIAHLVCTFPPYYKGGIGNVAFSQAKELIKLGHSVTVLTPQRGKEEPLVKIRKGIEIRRIRPLLRAGLGAFLPQLAWKLRDFDIIHLHYPFFGGAETVLFVRLIKFLKAPLVLHYHMDVKESKAGVLKYLLPLNKFVLPQILKSADKIIASSKDYIFHSQIKNYIKKHPEKFQEIPFGVDQERFYPQEKDVTLLGKYRLKADNKIILFVGGLDQAHYFKGVNYLLKALTTYNLQATSYKLIIVGDGDLRSSYEKLAQDLDIRDRVIFAGRVSDQDLPRYYNLADLFVLPSIDQSEAFGLVLLEAMACAKPCIASNLPGVRTVIDDKKTGLLIEPQNVDDLAGKIFCLLNDEELGRRFGQAGRIKVERKYNWQKIGQQLVSLYKIM